MLALFRPQLTVVVSGQSRNTGTALVILVLMIARPRMGSGAGAGAAGGEQDRVFGAGRTVQAS